MLSFIYLPLMLAAGSIATPVAAPCPAHLPAAKDAAPCPAPLPAAKVAAAKAAAPASGASLNQTTPSNSSHNSAPPSSGSCPPGFKNAVFNTDAAKHSGGLDVIWKSLTDNGVSNWIGFSINPLSQNGNYKTASGAPAPGFPDFDAAQIPICMDARDTATTLSKVQSSSPPAYVELYNEPDFSYGGVTPLSDPGPAAHALSQIFQTTTTTQFISPALAFTNSDWLTKFRDACAGCFSKIPIVSAHVYSIDQQGAYDQITTLHKTWPDSRIWITELAPASGPGDCTLAPDAVIKWMNTLIPRLAKLGYVEKVFWNTATWSPFDGDPNKCNPSLTNDDGSPTALLTAYGQVKCFDS